MYGAIKMRRVTLDRIFFLRKPGHLIFENANQL